MQTPKKDKKDKRLCKLCKFYIDHNFDTPDEVLSDYMRLSIDKIRNYKARVIKQREDDARLKAQEELEDRKIKESTEAVSINADNLMKRNKKRGVVIMTSEASQVADSLQKGPIISDKLSKNITKIRPE